MSAKKSYRFNELYSYTNMILLPLDYWTLMYRIDWMSRLTKKKDSGLACKKGVIRSFWLRSATSQFDMINRIKQMPKIMDVCWIFCTFSLNKRAEIFLKPVQTSGVHTDINPKNTGTMGPFPSPPELCFAWSNRTIQMSRSGRIRLSCIRSLKVHSRVTERTPWEHNKCPSSSANMQQQ